MKSARTSLGAAIGLALSVSAMLLAASRALGDYTPVEWIKASGSQWIFTGYTPAVDDRVEMKVMLASDSATQAFWCSRGTTTTTNTFTAFFVYANGKAWNKKARFDYGSTTSAADYSSAALAKSVVYVLSADGATKACTVTRASDSVVLATATMTEATPLVPLVPAGPFSLFASHTLGAGLTASTAKSQMNNFGTYTLYYFRVYGADGSLKRNFIPARDDAAASGSLAQYGLYETVGGTFHPGLGTGAFTAGGVSSDYRYNTETDEMEVRLSVTFDNRQGSVALNGDPLGSGDVVWLPAGASTTLSATPREGGTFDRWGGDAPAADVLSNPLAFSCGLPLTLLARFGDARPPAGYVPLAYIESTGTQWIDTKTVAQGANTSVEMDVTATTTPTDTAFFGYSWSGNQYLLILRSGNILFYGPGTTVAPYVAKHDYRLSVANGTVTVIDETTSTTNSKALTDTYAGTASLPIFANSSGGHKGSFRLRRMKIWRNGVLIRDFIPCYRSDAGGVATPGLYDLAGNYANPADGFFPNNGTGNFVMGAPLRDEIVIQGLPEAYGVPESTAFDGYGRGYLVGGTEFRATVPAAEQTATGGLTRFSPAGWTLSVTHLDGTSETFRSTAGTKAVCAYTPRDGDLATLTWQWESQSQLTVTADAGLTVDAPQWSSYGEQVRVTVGNDGAEFIAWEGDIPPLETFSTNFLLTVTGPIAIHARKADSILYVAPEAAGLADGSSWDNAFGNIQTALTVRAASPAGTLIRVAAGTYFVTNAITATQATNVVIRGGYTGIGDARGGETVVARDTAYSTLIFSLTKSRVLFDSLTVSNGFRAVAADSYGQGMALLGASVSAVRDCRFVLNGNGNNRTDKNLYGSAIGAQNGALAIDNCVFDRNSIHDGGASNVKPLGGAVGAIGATVRVRGSTFDRNYTQTVHARLHGGGALGFSGCPSVEIDHCTFTTNYTRRSTGKDDYTSGNQRGHGPYGGTIYITGSASATISDCTFFGGWNNAYDATYTDHNWGGLMAFRGSHVAMARCAILGAGWSGYTSGACFNYSSGSISLCGGSLHMTNVLHGAAYSGPALANYAYDTNSGGVIEAVNCTFAGGQGHGYQRKQAYVQTSGSATFRGCILWGNAGGDFYVGAGDDPTFEYCVTDTPRTGASNNSYDPLFGDATYFHPVSAAGRYAGGFFTGGSWVTDAETSPTIDAGDAAADVGDEPQPNFHRLNLGYDAGTAAASKSVCGDPAAVDPATVQIFAYPVSGLTADGDATISGEVASLGGGTNAVVTLVWGDADHGTDLAAWGANAYTFAGAYEPWHLLTHTLSGLTKGTYYYRLRAENDAGVAWSAPVRSFILGTRPTIAYAPPEAPVTHLYHSNARINVDLVDDGGMATTVHALYWPVAEPTDVQRTDANYGLVVEQGPVTLQLSGLTPGAEYAYCVIATNIMGGAVLATNSFTTISASTPAVLYVAPEASGRGDGSSYANATDDFQWAVNQTELAGDEIRLVAGTNTLANTVSVANHPGLVIRGGYTADNVRGGWSCIRRDSSQSRKYQIFSASASTITFDSVEIADGAYEQQTTFYGQGVSLNNSCTATFTNCLFRDNGVAALTATTASDGHTPQYGGALGMNGGTLTVVDCAFRNNRFWGGSCNTQARGGAIGAYNAAVSILRSSFDANCTQFTHSRAGGGGAIFLHTCRNTTIAECHFTTNYCRTSTGNANHGYTQTGPFGGTLYLHETDAMVTDCDITGGWIANGTQGGIYYGVGGVAFVSGASADVTFDRVRVHDCGFTGSTGNNKLNPVTQNDFCTAGGKLTVRNGLFTRAYGSTQFCNRGGVLNVVNCTVTGGRGLATSRSQQTLVHTSGTTTLRNTIFWGNSGDATYVASGATEPTVVCCDLEATDPLFKNATAGDYHLKPSSPVRDRGDKTGYTRDDVDLDHDRRVRGGFPDLGCFESSLVGTTVILR